MKYLKYCHFLCNKVYSSWWEFHDNCIALSFVLCYVCHLPLTSSSILLINWHSTLNNTKCKALFCPSVSRQLLIESDYQYTVMAISNYQYADFKWKIVITITDVLLPMYLSIRVQISIVIDSEICIDVLYCLKLTPGLLWVHNTNYIYMVLLCLFLSSFAQYNDRHPTVDDRATSCNIIPHDLWVEFRWSADNYLRIVYHWHILACGLGSRLLL